LTIAGREALCGRSCRQSQENEGAEDMSHAAMVLERRHAINGVRHAQTRFITKSREMCIARRLQPVI
jgi:hypothetical protein